MSLTRIGTALGILIVAGLGLALPARPAAGLKEWIDGPIRYLATSDESKAYRQLEDDPSRARFVERFWARRDPTPDTLINEYRQLFWERVKEANEKFTDSSAPGWKTDRGKIFILHGPPDEIREDLDADTKGLPAASRGLIRWTYQGRPQPRLDLDPIVVVPFVRDSTGEWRLSHDPTLASVFFDWTALRTSSTLPWEKWLSKNLGSGRSDLAVLMDQGKLGEIPAQEQVLLDRVVTYESYGAVPLKVEITRYQPPALQGATLVVVSVPAAQSSGVREPAVVARFTPKDATLRTKALGEGSFRALGSDRDRIVQGRLKLEPGTYDVTVLVADPEGAGNGLSRSVLVVSAAQSALRLSDAALVTVLEPVQYASLASYDEPFIVGAFRVVPRLGGSLAPGDSVQLFFEIYGGKPPYRVTYQLEGQEDNGEWKALGNPNILDRAEGAQGFSLPTDGKWPLGEYRVQVHVEDTGQQLAETTVPFTLAGRTAPGRTGM